MPPVRFVYVAVSCATGTEDGSPVNLREGDVWAADDPIVRFHPDLFSAEPPAPSFPRRTVAVVEQATAAPGEKRNTRPRG